MGREIISREEAQGFLSQYQGDVRASWADRKVITTYLREAHKDGRLTSEQFHLRAEDAINAESQVGLARLIRDLPKPVTKMKRITRFSNFMVALHKDHPALFYPLMIVVSLVLVAAVTVPQLIMGATFVYNTGWGTIPVFGYILGALGLIASLVSWVCD